MTAKPPSLSISDLRVTAADGRPLLSVSDLSVHPGERIAIRGPSGAGKSTFLYTITGLIAASEGRVAWGDFDLARAKSAERTAFRGRHIGLVLQEHFLFDELSALENASLAACYAPRQGRAALARRARESLATLGIEDGGAQRLESFSGGERQRVAVARALASDPAILIADEPTASLDRANADRLIEDLFRQATERGSTLIAVSHDPALLETAGRVLTIEDGKLRDD
ncbi:MAG: ATP-binding cassette domain-containing protein [Pseudomonadota bacterium]